MYSLSLSGSIQLSLHKLLSLASHIFLCWRSLLNHSGAQMLVVTVMPVGRVCGPEPFVRLTSRYSAGLRCRLFFSPKYEDRSFQHHSTLLLRSDCGLTFSWMFDVQRVESNLKLATESSCLQSPQSSVWTYGIPKGCFTSESPRLVWWEDIKAPPIPATRKPHQQEENLFLRWGITM